MSGANLHKNLSGVAILLIHYNPNAVVKVKILAVILKFDII